MAALGFQLINANETFTLSLCFAIRSTALPFPFSAGNKCLVTRRSTAACGTADAFMSYVLLYAPFPILICSIYLAGNKYLWANLWHISFNSETVTSHNSIYSVDSSLSNSASSRSYSSLPHVVTSGLATSPAYSNSVFSYLPPDQNSYIIPDIKPNLASLWVGVFIITALRSIVDIAQIIIV